jgi:peptidoglycan lytic transglycosylase
LGRSPDAAFFGRHATLLAVIAIVALSSALALVAAPPPQGQTRKPAAQVDSDEAAETELPTLDITAYFGDGPFKAAQRMVAHGDTRAAVQLLKKLLRERPDAAERPQARYLLGLSLIQLGDYEEAARLFDELSVSYPLLRDDHLFFRGQSLYLWGSYLQAAEVLANVDISGPRGEEARRLRAWALLKATDFERLVRWLEGLEKKEGTLDPELEFILARARHRTGDVLGAYRAFRDVWREAPAGKLAGPALVYIAELRIGDKAMLGDVERSAIRALEGRLMSGKEVDRAMADLDKRLERPKETSRLRAEIAYARGRIAQAQGRLIAGEQHYERALALAPVEMVELRARVGLEQGRVHERLGQEQKALAAYKTVAERFPDRAESEDSLYSAAQILLSERKYKDAQETFQALLLKNPVTKYRPKCLWGIGWAHFRLGQADRAVQFFGSLAKMKAPADVDAASHYWFARSQATLGKVEEARESYRAVIRNHPLSHYAALAEDQLAEGSHQTKESPDVTAKSAEKEGPKRELVQVREYVRLGLKARGLEAISSYEKNERKAGRRFGEATLHDIARIYDELGQNMEARRVREECAREYPRSLGDEEFIAVAKRAHPMKYEEPIRSAADEFGISDSLLFGLIRTESGFRPDAISNMAAYGLAQLILPTAITVAQKIHAGRATKSRLLYEPEFNVRVGAAYLRSLLDRFAGSEPLALMAYNAGPNAVDAWLAYRVRKLEGIADAGKGVGLAPAPDELAEEIPVQETRDFVKNVLARSRAYARLYPRKAKLEAPVVPLAEGGPLAEPRDLPSAPKAIADLGRGARVARDSTGDDPREQLLYSVREAP